jgi:hypothetical protein
MMETNKTLHSIKLLINKAILKAHLYNCCRYLSKNHSEGWSLKHLSWVLSVDSRVALIAFDYRIPKSLRDALVTSFRRYNEFSERCISCKIKPIYYCEIITC